LKKWAVIVSQIFLDLLAINCEFAIYCKIISNFLCFNTGQRNWLAFGLPFLPRLSRLVFYDCLDPASVGVPLLSGEGGYPSACQVRQA
jgi:hypothetical protein